MTVTDTQRLHKFGVQSAEDEFRIAITCLGARISVVLPNSSWIADLLPYLPPGWEAAVPAAPSELDISYKQKSHLMPSGVESFSPENRATVAEVLASDIEYAIAERSEQYVFVHAGVVALDGKALLFPGESHSGKSTLVAALVHHGATYYSDEYAVVNDDGLVLPFPRHIALRNDFIHSKGRTDLSAHAPDLRGGKHGIRTRQIMFLKYESGGTWQGEPLDNVAAFIELCKNTVGFRNRPDMSFVYLHRLLENTRCFQGIRGDAEEAAKAILK